jgi:hypothetical protein
MNDNSVPNANWRLERQPDHLLLEHRIREGSGRAILLSVGLCCVLFFGYWVLAMVTALIAEPASVEIGGYVFLLVMLGGLAFGVYTLLRLTAVTRYQVRPDILHVDERRRGKSVHTEIPSVLVTELTCAHTPSKATRGEDTYKIVLHWKEPGGQARWLAMEGDRKPEADWLGAILSTWAGKPVHHERTGS